MQVALRAVALDGCGADAVVLPVVADPVRVLGAAAVERFGVDAAALADRHGVQGEPGEVFSVPLAAESPRAVVLAGIGAGTAAQWRRTGAALGRRCRDYPVLALPLDDLGDLALAALAEGVVLGSYRYRVAGAASKGAGVRRVDLLTADPAARQPVLDGALAGARATVRTRDLANTPSLTKSPQWLAEQAVALAERASLSVRVRDEAELAAEGFGGLLAVGAGSVRPPRLIELSYRPPQADTHVVLVGKGITFDSGGLSLKPTDGMVSMKTDMAGGAAVLGVMGALADRDIRVRVTGLVPAAENLPSGSAQRPGDVIRHYGGRTSEVLNTDAEGRLVLADALAYAHAELDPDVVVDLATLTGAATLGLGRRHAALYATSDALAAALEVAAERSGERVWRMPLVADYRFAIDSRVADVANTATRREVSGGSILAALFLQEFTGGRTWAHLDIAGPARSDAEEDEVTKGATGFGARLLLRWLEGLSRPEESSRPEGLR